jgi:hypothetical protein
MAKDLSGDLARQINTLIASDPELQRLAQAVNATGVFSADGQRARIAFFEAMAARGIRLPEDYNWRFDPSLGTSVDITRDNFFERNKDWILPVAVGSVTGLGLAGVGGGATGTASAMNLGPTLAGGGAVTPPAPPAGLTVPTTGAASGGIGGALASLPSWLGPAITAATPVIGRAVMGGGPASGPTTGAVGVPPELSELLQDAMRRMRSQEPLFQATTRQAFAGLPDYVKRG